MHRRTFALAGLTALLGAATATAASGALDGPRKAPARGAARYLVAMLHGYGSNGADLFGLAPEFHAYVPSAAFVAPDAPFPVGGGFSWSDPARGRAPGDAATASGGPRVEAFLAAELARLGLGADRLILIGFSQGASLALNNGLRHPVPPAAVICFSGANLVTEGLPREGRRPPLLLVRGDQDFQMATGSQERASKALAAMGIAADAHVLPGLGHGIDRRGVTLAGALIGKVTAGG